jgi:hypothetical protein
VLRLSIPASSKHPLAIESALYIGTSTVHPKSASMESSDGGSKTRGKPERTTNKIPHTAVSVPSVSSRLISASQGIAITYEVAIKNTNIKNERLASERERHRDNE